MKLLVVVAVAGLAFAQDQSGALQGTVVNRASHVPVKKAHVLLTRAPTPPSTMVMQRAATTDANGNFLVDGLPPGMYRVQVFAADYPSARMGSGPASKSVQVMSGGTPAKVDFELAPGAAISGRIVDEDGDPVPRCFVQVRTAGIQLRPGRFSTSQQTNDDGRPGATGDNSLPRGPADMTEPDHERIRRQTS